MLIKGLDIFITWDQFRQLHTDQVKAKLKALPRLGPENFDSITRAKNKIFFDEIQRKYVNDDFNITEFISKWMKFDLSGKEAQENTWNLLRDFCSQNSCTILKDYRTIEEQISGDEWHGGFNYYPMGRDFSLIFKVPEKRNWYGKIVRPYTELEVFIDTQNVTRLKGEFKTHFTIYMTDRKLECGRGMQILPLEE